MTSKRCILLPAHLLLTRLINRNRGSVSPKCIPLAMLDTSEDVLCNCDKCQKCQLLAHLQVAGILQCPPGTIKYIFGTHFIVQW